MVYFDIYIAAQGHLVPVFEHKNPDKYKKQDEEREPENPEKNEYWEHKNNDCKHMNAIEHHSVQRIVNILLRENLSG